MSGEPDWVIAISRPQIELTVAERLERRGFVVKELANVRVRAVDHAENSPREIPLERVINRSNLRQQFLHAREGCRYK